MQVTGNVLGLGLGGEYIHVSYISNKIIWEPEGENT